MPSRETPSYSSSRVQRASRLNSLEQARLQHRLMLLEKARLHQARLTNQDIRLTSIALDYILHCSGHSPEGRGPDGQQGGTDPGQPEDPCFLYGERVVSRKVRRMPRPQSAVERATYRRSEGGQGGGGGGADSESSISGGEESVSVHSRLPPRPQSSPAKGRSWAWYSASTEEGNWAPDPESERPPSRGKPPTPAPSSFNVSPAVSRPPTAGSGGRGTPGWGRVTPHQAWEDDTDEVTKKILKAQKRQQQQQQQQQQDSRRSSLYMQDINRMRSQTPTSARGIPKQQNRGAADHHASPFPAQRVSSPGTPVATIEDRKPVSPRQRRAGGADRRAGLTEIVSQARPTVSASAWRSHLASTPVVPRSLESQRQVILEAKRSAEKRHQQHVTQRVKTFIGQLNGCT